MVGNAWGRWVEEEVGFGGGAAMCSGGSFTSWHLGLRQRHPPPPPAAADATGRWGDGGWPACRTSVSARPLWTCFPPGSSQWRRSCQSCRNPALWSQPGFSGENKRKKTLRKINKKVQNGVMISRWWVFSKIRNPAFSLEEVCIPEISQLMVHEQCFGGSESHCCGCCWCLQGRLCGVEANWSC